MIDVGSRDAGDKEKFVTFMMLVFGGSIGSPISGDACVTGLEYRRNPQFLSKEEILLDIESPRHRIGVREIVDVTGMSALSMLVEVANYLKVWSLAARLAGKEGGE